MEFAKQKCNCLKSWRLQSWLPSRGNVLFTLLVVAALLIANRAGALTLAAPTVASTATIPYQGRLTNTDGTPRNGLTNMEFRLYNVASGGSALWTEFWTGGNSVRVTDGMFSILLGSLNNTLSSVVQGNSQLWLGITVNTDAEMSPRVQLGSTAYALQALTVPDASVGSAKIADGAVTTRKTKSLTYTRSDNAVIDLSVAHTWFDLPPLSITIPASDIPVTTNALVLFYARCKTNSDQLPLLIMHTLDGVWTADTDAYPMAGQMLNFTLHDLVTLSPNINHTLQISWKLYGAGSAQCAQRKFSVILLGQ